MDVRVYIGTPENWAQAQADILEAEAYALSDGVPLSATGKVPITHRGTSTGVYLNSPLQAAARSKAGLLDEYTDPWDVVLKNLGLYVVAPLPPEEEASADDVCRA